MRRIASWMYAGYCVLSFLPTLPVAALGVALAAIPGGPEARRRVWRVIHAWATFYLFLTGRRVTYVNEPPQLEGFVVVVLNHQSYLDAVTAFPAVPGYFRPLGKKELAKIPLFGFIYKQIVLLVDQTSPHSRARSMKLMIRSLRHEGHVALFPEGTFNETADPMLPFYDGAFRLAIEAQVPIVPVLLPDTDDRWDGTHLWKMSPGRNRVYYLSPVSTEGMTQKDLPALREKVRERMAVKLQQLKTL